MPKMSDNLYVRLSEEDKGVISRLERIYPGMSRSDIVRQALKHMAETHPTITITIEPHAHTQAVARLG